MCSQDFMARAQELCSPLLWKAMDSHKKNFTKDLRDRLAKLTGMKFSSGGRDYVSGMGASLRLRNKILTPIEINRRRTPPTDEYDTPEEAFQSLVGKVADLFVPNVQGKWITPVDVATCANALCHSKAVWCWIGGDENISPRHPIVEILRVAFSDAVHIKWVKQVGGKSYPGGIKVYGHHMMNCILRNVEDAAKPTDSGPSEAHDDPSRKRPRDDASPDHPATKQPTGTAVGSEL